jgi:hypothetical protein
MTEGEEVKVRKRRSGQGINRLVLEFEASDLRRSEFCNKHGLALSTLQRGLRKTPQGSWRTKRTPIDAGNGSGRPEQPQSGSALEVAVAQGRRIEVRPDFDVATLSRLIREKL